VATELSGRPLEIVQGRNFATVSTLREDGSIQSNVIWVHADDDGTVFVNSAEGRAWPANLRRDPRVTLAVPNWEDPYEHVAIRGRAVEITSEGATEHIDSLAFKYRGEKTYSGKQRDERLKIRIEPERVTHYGG
jgi:PPOX class probable F420-dependent enzyme